MRPLPEMMKAIVLDEAKTDFALEQRLIPLPEPTNCQVLVKVERVGLNPLDVKLAQTGFNGWQYPHIPGLDAVGIVVKAPLGTTPAVGDRVMWHADVSRQGVLSEYACIANHAVSIVPDSVTSQAAAALPCAGMTALIAIEKLQLKDGDNLLIDGAGGVVGQYAIQLARMKGATVYGLANKKQHACLKKLGAEEVFDYQHSELDKKISLALGSPGFDAVLDSVGGDNTQANIARLRFCGRIACLNGLSNLSNEQLAQKAPTISIVSLAGAWLTNSICGQQKMLFLNNFLLQKLDSQELKTSPIIDVKFTAEAVQEAFQRQLQSGCGKQVVHIS